MSNTPNGYAHIKTFKNEYIKSHIVYVGSLMSIVYEARANALNGEPCLKTSYAYSGTLITDMKEEESTWNSSWDF